MFSSYHYVSIVTPRSTSPLLHRCRSTSRPRGCPSSLISTSWSAPSQQAFGFASRTSMMNACLVRRSLFSHLHHKSLIRPVALSCNVGCQGFVLLLPAVCLPQFCFFVNTVYFDKNCVAQTIDSSSCDLLCRLSIK